MEVLSHKVGWKFPAWTEQLQLHITLEQTKQNGGAGVYKWMSEGSKRWRSGESAHRPPMLKSNVARFQIPASTPYVGWVCCWFCPLLQEVFLRVLRFSPLLKNQHSIFQFDQESGRRRTALWMWYLQIIIITFIVIYLLWALLAKNVWLFYKIYYGSKACF